MKEFFLRRSAIGAAVGLVLGIPSAWAGEVAPGKWLVVEGANTEPETWFVREKGRLHITSSARTLALITQDASLQVTQGSVVSGVDNGIRAYGASSVLVQDASVSGINNGIEVDGDQYFSPVLPGSVARLAHSSVSGGTTGAHVLRGGTLALYGSQVTATGSDSYGILLRDGELDVAAGSVVEGVRAGVKIEAMPRFGSGTLSKINIESSTIRSQTGPAIDISGSGERTINADVVIGDNVAIESGAGVAIHVRDRAIARVSIGESYLRGDVLADRGSDAYLRVRNKGVVEGRVDGAIQAVVDAGGLIHTSGTSGIRSLDLRGGTIEIGRVDEAPSALILRESLTSSGGRILLAVRNDRGAPAASQGADSLLIKGDVVSPETRVLIRWVGDGHSTDANANGIADANEGYSVIQVGGNASKDSFRLEGEYLAVGPYQYELKPFSPGEVDQGGNRLGDTPLAWDFRLATKTVCKEGCGPGGESGSDGASGSGGDGGVSRSAVAPQVAQYLSGPAAALAYGRVLDGGLTERLSEVRRGQADGVAAGDLFAHYVGAHGRYRSNLSFKQYGYGFDQRIEAMQIGGSVLSLDGDSSSLRAGWSWDRGSTTVSPFAVDGKSMSRYHAYGFSTWLTWLHSNGAWVEALGGSRRMVGYVDTAARGRHAAKIVTRTGSMSLAMGWPISLSDAYVLEPRIGTTISRLNSRQRRDTDGLVADMRPMTNVDITFGARLSGDLFESIRQFVAMDVTVARKGASSWSIRGDGLAKVESFDSGRVGSAYRLSTGASAQVGRNTLLYAQAEYRHGLGAAGMRSFGLTAGIRIAF
ncbi:hypothetical protein KPL74_06825 [Bacillus sp. NP157]|nr:hypothetical protein KPL74_06825 [Bacillus sp. NP157]